MQNNVVVGINNTYFEDIHEYSSDGNVSIMVNGILKMAIAEERVSRKKYDGGFEKGLTYILKRLNLTKDDVDEVVLVGFGRFVDGEKNDSILFKSVYDYFERELPITYMKSHHEAHAWTAIAQLGLKKSLIAVLDHSGSILEYGNDKSLDSSRAEQTSYYLWDGKELTLVERDHDGFGALGYGRLYSKVTRYIGFRSYHESGKTMGLAPIGKNEKIDLTEEAYFNEDGKEVTNITHAKYSEDGLEDLKVWFDKFQDKEIGGPYKSGMIEPEQVYLARWIQYSLEQSVIRKIKRLIEKYDVDSIAVTGGVALNSVMNSKIEEATGKTILVPSSPGDAGLSYGALAYYYNLTEGKVPNFGKNPFLGPVYSKDEIISTLEKYSNIEYRECCSIEQEAARLLNDEKIIAWYQGAGEFGPRALGNRSIISSAKNPWDKEVINHMVKRREWFRPFAPSILIDSLHRYFKTDYENFEYMMKVSNVNDEHIKEIPSAIHFDNSARLQTVSKELNEKYYNLISEYEKLGNPPVVLNTSFNLNGMPLVETPQDAIDCFLIGGFIDYLIIDNFIVRKITK